MNNLARIRSKILAVSAAIAVVAILLHFHLPRIMHALDDGPQVRATNQLSPFQLAVVTDLDRQRNANIRYQDGYYIGGEPPANIGVCTDVVARSFRAAGVNLRSEVNADIVAHPGVYHIAKPDKNIDYRRSRNLAVFFKRHAKMLPITPRGGDWEPADVVIFDWMGNGVPSHCAMIGNNLGPSGIPMIVHHLPGYPVRMTDDLANIPVLYHFRWPYRQRASHARLTT